MRIIEPGKLKTRPYNGPGLPAWVKEWKENQGRWILLWCGCISDVNLPSCVQLLTGKRIFIQCDSYPSHGFQLIRKTLKFSEVIEKRLGIKISPDNDPEGLFPPF